MCSSFAWAHGNRCCCFSDPGTSHEFSDILFDNDAFTQSLYNSLNDEGVFICQTGETITLSDPSSFNGRERDAVVFKQRLISAGFKKIVEYDDVSGLSPLA